MRVFPISAMEHILFDEGMRKGHECSDRIWVSPAEHARLTASAAGSTILLRLSATGTMAAIAASRVYGVLHAIHREPAADVVYVPRWMYEWLGGLHAPPITIERVNVNPCTSLTLQPILSDNSNIAVFRTPEALQRAFRRYACIQYGRVYTFLLEGQEYRISILDTKPCCDVVCVLNSDIEIEILNAWIPMHRLLTAGTGAAAVPATATAAAESTPFHVFVPPGHRSGPSIMPTTGGYRLDPTPGADVRETPEEIRRRVADAARKRLERKK